MDKKDVVGVLKDQSFSEAKTKSKSELRSEINEFLTSVDYLNEAIEQIRLSDDSPKEKYSRICELRKTSYVTHSAYFPEIMNQAVTESRILSLVNANNEVIKENTGYLEELGLRLVITPEGYQAWNGSVLYHHEPNYLADDILFHIGVTADNHASFQLLAGYLESPTVREIMMMSFLILAVSDKIEKTSFGFAKW